MPDSRFEVKDGLDNRPKPINSSVMVELARERKELIEARLKTREQLHPRPQRDTSQTPSNAEATQGRDGSKDKSTDSNRLGTTSQMDVDTSKKMSDMDPSEERAARRLRKKIKAGGEDPEELVFISLGETGTNEILFIPSMCVPNDDEEACERHKKVAREYDEMLVLKRGSDNFNTHSSQVLMMPMKHKSELTPVSLLNEGTKASHSQAYPFEIDRESLHDEKSAVEVLKMEMKAAVDKEFEQKLRDPYGLVPTDLKCILVSDRGRPKPEVVVVGKPTRGAREAREDRDLKVSTHIRGTEMGQTESIRSRNIRAGNQGSRNKSNTQDTDDTLKRLNKEFKSSLEGENEHLIMTEEELKLVNSEVFMNNIKFTERILNQTKYHKEFVQYRNYPEIDLKQDRRGEGGKGPGGGKRGNKDHHADQEAEKTPKVMSHLFNFYHESFKDRTVSSMDWNPINKELLAATYGEFDLQPPLPGQAGDHLDGYLAFWTLKNPNNPERKIKTSSRAMSCKFSPRNPNLIGVGMYDGVVAIYDIRNKGDKPIADSKELDTKHLDVVWVESLDIGSELGWERQQ